MSGLEAEFVALLACPKCRGPLERDVAGLRCPACGLAFPVRDGVPVLLLEEAQPADRA
jgi:uncharacterized protein YbaR (Trm112 family)